MKININWKKNKGLLPAIIQDDRTDQVLMLGYMNKEAFKKTLRTKKVWFWSRSKGRLWMKGETSGNFLKLKKIVADCDLDTFLVRVEANGPTCHTGMKSCFGEETTQDDFINDLFHLIESRKKELPKGSYTASLFKKGLKQITAKIEEEALEVIQAARRETKKRLAEESADLIYHLLVLLAQKGVAWERIEGVLKKRMNAKQLK